MCPSEYKMFIYIVFKHYTFNLLSEKKLKPIKLIIYSVSSFLPPAGFISDSEVAVIFDVGTYISAFTCNLASRLLKVQKENQ